MQTLYKISLHFIGLIILIAANGCQKKYDLSSLPSINDVVAVGDTSYIEKGSWSGLFTKPRAILYGQDQLFYVADTYGNRVTMLNQAGQILSSSKPILHPISLAQDNRLDLLVGAESIEANGDTIGIVLRIQIVKNINIAHPANHNLDLAKMEIIWKEPARPKRRFVGIAVMPNDEYLIARDGPDNSSVVDPDARILRFKYTKLDSVIYVKDSVTHVIIDSVTHTDRFITPLSDLQTGQGSSITSINHPTGIATFPKSYDFIVTQSSDGIQYSIIWMVFSNEFQVWTPKYDPTVAANIDFIRPNRFTNARGVTIDQSKNIFIVDAEQDSVVKFNSLGRFKMESFGKKTPGINLNNPSSIAVAEKTVYVCDTDNNRIVLYRLSTDN